MRPTRQASRWRLLLLRGHIWLLAGVIPLLVRLLSLPRVTGLLTPPARFRPYASVSADCMTALTARRLRRPRNMRRRACLREGLTLFHFLRLAGLPAMLHIGVYPPSTDPGRMHAHCWVSLQEACLSSPPGHPVAVVFSSNPMDGVMG